MKVIISVCIVPVTIHRRVTSRNSLPARFNYRRCHSICIVLYFYKMAARSRYHPALYSVYTHALFPKYDGIFKSKVYVGLLIAQYSILVLLVRVYTEPHTIVPQPWVELKLLVQYSTPSNKIHHQKYIVYCSSIERYIWNWYTTTLKLLLDSENKS